MKKFLIRFICSVILVGNFLFNASAQTCSGASISISTGQTCSEGITNSASNVVISVSGTLTNLSNNSLVSNAGQIDSFVINSGGLLSGVSTVNGSTPFAFKQINNTGAISLFENRGSVLMTAYNSSIGFGNEATVTIFNNYGAFSNNNTNGNQATITNGYLQPLTSVIGAINNYGSITASGPGSYSIWNLGTINTLNNYSGATIQADDVGIGTKVYGRPDSPGIIGILNNAGTIRGDGTAAILNGGTTEVLTNTGSIISDGGYGIQNSADITTLNNAQGAGNAASALTYTGALPSNYNIIINSPTSYGKLAVTSGTGTTTFGIFTGSTVANGTYSAVLSGLDANKLTATTGSYNSATWTLSNSSGSIWDLIISGYLTSNGPSSFDTQSSMQYQASQLRSAFNTQTVAANFALNYDCNVFDVKGMCISAGGRYTTIDNPGINNSAAVVTLGYKVNPNIRVGAYLDQNINISNPTGINISNNTPLMGLYAVWNKEQSGLGYQVRLANTYQDKDVTSTRTVFDTSEAGSGKSSLQSQSYLAELSYAFQYQDKTLVRPYAGLRYTHLKQDGYTEATVTSSVDNPLTVAALRDKSATALLGVKINRSLTDKATLTAQLGLEQDVHHKVGNYSATNSNIGDLDSVAFNSNIKRTRPVASIGAFYDVTKTQRASATINYQQTPFQSTGSTTAYFNYMIGF